MQTPDELARLNHYLGIHGLPPMDNPRAVVQALAFLIETEPEFRRVLAKCRPELRRDMYEALKPQLSFPVKPLDVYIAEFGMEAEAKRLPTIDENGQLHEHKVPEVETCKTPKT